MPMNESLFLTLDTLKNSYSIIETIAIFCARWLPWIMIVVIMTIIIFHVAKRHHPTLAFLGFIFYEIVSIITTLFITLGFVSIMKYVIDAPRPFVVFDINPSIIHGLMDSFPSGHAAIFFALAWITGYFEKRFRLIFIITAFLIAISRVVVGVHYPIDIIMGGLIGISIAMLVHRYIKNRVSTTFFTKNK